ncbi:TonB family protein [Oceaniserpentilla sp. 4NH20-0058]|uniref:energy transducer TonB n=1 Tax=Oceaniserpentilla sp. 4NH20-0058 TaxID=3127660 RepID=UPI0033419A1E
MKLIIITPLGIALSIFVFWLMQLLITPSSEQLVRNDNIAMVDFIRSIKDSKAEEKKRNPKEPEKPKTPPLLDSPKIQKTQAVKVDLEMPDITNSLASFKGQGVGNMLSGYGFGDSDVIPLVQVEPRYPSQALARKIEGYVVVRLKVSKEGVVDDVEVVDADPKGVFEREAIRAAWRYKFKPKLVDGKPVEQIATLPFEFNLEK